jgi:hypothetical protein
MQRTTSSRSSNARESSRLFLLLVGTAGLLRDTTELLAPVLALLACSKSLVYRP